MPDLTYDDFVGTYDAAATFDSAILLVYDANLVYDETATYDSLLIDRPGIGYDEASEYDSLGTYDGFQGMGVGGVRRAIRTGTTTIGGNRKRQGIVGVGGFVTDPGGSFRGIMNTDRRDRLELKQPKDIVFNRDTSQEEFYASPSLGWLGADRITSKRSRKDRKQMAPTTAGWRWEDGDEVYPARYWDGTNYRFRLDNAGVVEAVAFRSRSVSAPNASFSAYNSGGTEIARIHDPGGSSGHFLLAGAGRIALYTGTLISSSHGAALDAFDRALELWPSTGESSRLQAISDGLVEINSDSTSATTLRIFNNQSGVAALQFGTDIQLSRGAANRLDLADGDAFRWGGGAAVCQLDNGGWIELAERTTPGLAAADKLRLYGKLVGGEAFPHVIHETAGSESRLAGLAYAQTWTAGQTFTAAITEFERGAASNDAIRTRVTADANPRLAIQADGDHEYGTGAAAADVFTSRATGPSFEIGKSGSGNAIQGWEMTAPAAPSANGYRIFGQDNGSGKTQLMVIFGSGAAQQIQIEP